MKISATLITLNEERNLLRALESLRCCDEWIVVDSGSSDRTREIAEAFGAKVLRHDWQGYTKQKNFAARAAAYDWVLALDADEALSGELASEIEALKHGALNDAGPEFSAYRFPRRARYLGKWIRHSGWYPDRKVRLYDRRKARWVGDYVHESVEVDAAAGDLDGDLLHYTCESLAEHVATANRYTTLAAREIAASGRRVRWRDLTVAPAWTFFQTCVLKQGFRDGIEGLAIAWMAAFYVFLKYMKAARMETPPDPPAGREPG